MEGAVLLHSTPTFFSRRVAGRSAVLSVKILRVIPENATQ